MTFKPRHRRITLAAGLLATACACANPTPQAHTAELRSPQGDCAGAAVDGGGVRSASRVRWQVHSAASDRHELDQWCRGVGAPVITAATATLPPVDSVAVITWNIHVGAARLDAFVSALRSGALTGTPTEHFVLLVQEARRIGGGVPHVLAADARGTRRFGDAHSGERADIVATAQRLGLSLFYAPSMRNGGSGHAAEDRGNAILSSLPLADPTAIELPLLAQRRVAVAATVPLVDGAGRTHRLRVTSVHLDTGARITRSATAVFGPGRTLQAGALADALAGERDVVIGGDFNTWSHDRLEGGLARMRADFGHFPAGAGKATHYTAGFWPRRLDHLFMRGVEVSGTAPDRIDDRWGSDHYPVMAWVRLDPAAGL